ncbi:MAG TPA: hypothetical protein VGJ60_37105 [Chloroflexota bacterium]
MTALDFPLDARLGRIEERLGAIERDMATVKTRLEHLPSRWMQWLFALAILMPMYGILVTLLWATIHL